MVISRSNPLHEEEDEVVVDDDADDDDDEEEKKDDDDDDDDDVDGTPLNTSNCASLCSTTIVSSCNSNTTLSSPVALVSVLTAEEAICKEMLTTTRARDREGRKRVC